ncbi:hypothetical protein M430DRAFT_22748 [Amorphotheca resinae ATCC 22711]|uniref:Uncharacterized protein n=1 Tax=Amorphotheca resinae ATCC 22711 TaxID=857342 RepID=A0A2T3AQG8_AMORE|nr:hypothetical protein M430DRAFT_22748 [Amorphotheca resinae ATCC 22711]PSS08511.1 hypothetical protein M430DRAFT_22748 [Amorphotheca resinae ATCC 22711]
MEKQADLSEPNKVMSDIALGVKRNDKTIGDRYEAFSAGEEKREMSSTIDCLSLSMAVVAGSVRFQSDLSGPDAFAMPSGGRRCTASTVSLDTILFVAMSAEEPFDMEWSLGWGSLWLSEEGSPTCKVNAGRENEVLITNLPRYMLRKTCDHPIVARLVEIMS